MTQPTSAQELLRIRNEPGYLNFLAVGQALHILCDGLRHFVEVKMKDLHSKLLAKLGGTQCLCGGSVGVRPSPHVKRPCLWSRELMKLHRNPTRIPWRQSDSSKWHDPVDGYWEIAKIFMSDLGTHSSTVKDPKSTDPTGLLNLMIFCAHFNVKDNLLKAVRECRNTLAHSKNLTLSEMEKVKAFNDIANLLGDVELKSCKSVQDCRGLIEQARVAIDTSIFQERELHILFELRHLLKLQKDHDRQSQIQAATALPESTDSRYYKRKILHELRLLRKLLSEMPRQSQMQRCEVLPVSSNSTNTLGMIYDMFIFLIALFMHIPLLFFHKFSKFLVVSLLICEVGDKSTMVVDQECFHSTKKSSISHFEFQEFNCSSYLVYKGESFFGRRWLFNELEETFITGGGRPVPGVLITAEPGSGKTALVSRLICSQFSSWFINKNIIGYHMCRWDEKGKRSGGRFVRNLVHQIAGMMPEYSDLVANDEQIRRTLDNRCESYPVECFSSAIVEPLRDISQPDDIRYILLDALDECIDKDGKTSAILDMLNSKISYFPKWLKVILTSRNWTAVTARIPKIVKRMPLNPMDIRNIEDIRSYIVHTLSQNSDFTVRLLEAMRLKSTSTNAVNSLIDELVRSGEGNFLVVKTTLQYMDESYDRTDIRSFPTSLKDTYDIFFKRHFAEKDLRDFRALIEVLLAAGSPLNLTVIGSILKLQNQTQEVSVLVEHMSSFLRFGEVGTVWIYHKSLAEWLVDQTTYPVSKTKGHQYIADFLFDNIRKKNDCPSVQELSELTSHVLLGGNEERHQQALDTLLNISKIRDEYTSRTILHYLAVKDNAVPTLELFLRKFQSADILDVKGMSPAFYAASEGKTANLRLFIKNGADVNSVFLNFSSTDPMEILLQNRGIEEFSMVHVAAYKGHSRVVEVLLSHNITYPRSNLPTPLQLAAGNGHLEVVKLLYNRERHKIDRLILLHHAAARNQLVVVEFLLKTAGIRDECLPCKSGNHRFSVQNVTVRELHLSLCETALHAAVSRGHYDVVELLLNYGNASLECRHNSGKTVLMDAVERNDTNMVKLLLDKGANVEEECGDKRSRPLNDEICDNLALYKDGLLYTVYCEKDECACGNKACHLAARYGLWEMARLLVYKGNAKLHSKNCNGNNVAQVAVMFDQAQFIYNINRTGMISWNDLWLRLILFSAARCGSTETLKLFNPDILTSELGAGFTVLEMVVFHSSPDPKHGAFHSCLHALSAGDSYDIAKKIDEESRKRVAAIKFLVKSQKNNQLILQKKCKATGGTVLHIAASCGFKNGVQTLVELGSDQNIRDDEDRTPLKYALTATPVVPTTFTHCYATPDGVFTTCNTTSYDATAAYIISLQGTNINICDAESAELLAIVVMKQMPLSLYSLIKTGIDMNCGVNIPSYPFLQHLNYGGKQISEVFKIFGIGVSVKCGVPFRESELHLMSYLATPDNVGNFFKPAVNKQPFPLQRLVDNHPKRFHIIDECRDAEGYLAVHRAAQGGNLDAINWFISLGVDLSQKTLSGLTALDLSILYLDEHKDSKTFYSYVSKSNSLSNPVYRLPTFDKLLSEYFKSSVQCTSDAKLKGLTPFHIAAVKGVDMLKYVHKKAREIVPDLQLECTNKHGIVPRYLAYFYESIDSTKGISNKHLGNAYCNAFDMSLIQYPDRDAEYHIIYNYFYQSPNEIENQRFFALLPKLENYDISDCPGFNDFLPAKEVPKNKDQSKKEHEVVEDDDDVLVTEIICPVLPQNCVKTQSIKTVGFYRPKICTSNERSKIEYYAEEKYCPMIKQHLQEWFMSRPRKNRQVSKFIAERMGWTATSSDGDVLRQWPFYFLYRKLTNDYKDYKYLETLNEGLEIYNGYYREDDEDDEDE